MRSLEIHRILPYRFSYKYDELTRKMNTSYLINVLKRCGIYLQEVTVDSYHIKDALCSQTIDIISEHCNNITTLKLIQLRLFGEFWTEERLKNLFSSNLNITSISLTNFDIKGDCLLNLDTAKIKKLCLCNCRFQNHGFFYGFIANLKNLNMLELRDDLDKINLIIDTFIISKCDSLFEIKLFLFEASLINNLNLFLSRQKSIRKIEIYGALIENNFFEKLSTDCLEELHLKFSETQEISKINPSVLLSMQKKLRFLQLRNVLIDTKVIKMQEKIMHVESLEEFHLEYSENQSGNIVSYLSLFLSKLKNILKLTIKGLSIDERLMKSLPTVRLEELNIDVEEIEILKSLDRFGSLQSFEAVFLKLTDDYFDIVCKFINENIQKMEIGFHFYEPSLKRVPHLSRLKNLETFIINYYDSSCEPVGVDNIIDNISQFSNLKHLKIDTCTFSTSKLINCASSLKNLTSLYIDYIDVEDEEFVEIIQKAVNLRELKILYNNNIFNNFVTNANEVKLKRGDSHILKIIFHDCEFMNLDDFQNIPLIEVDKLFY